MKINIGIEMTLKQLDSKYVKQTCNLKNILKLEFVRLFTLMYL